MHCAAAARAPTDAESPQFHIVTDSCVLMRGGAIWCAAARSCEPAPPARKIERFFCTHAPGARGRLARAARRSAGRFFYAVLCALAMHAVFVAILKGPAYLFAERCVMMPRGPRKAVLRSALR